MAAPILASGRPAPTEWTRRGLAIVTLCFVINMADGVDVTILSFIAPRLQAEWGIGAGSMGRLFGAGLIGMALGGTLIAPLADRYGRRLIILGALVIMSAGMVASGFAGSVAMLFALRVLVGVGIGTVLAAMAALAAESAPAHQRNLAVGIVQAGYPFAAVFTGLTVATLLTRHGWQSLLLGAGVLTLVLLPIAYAVLPRQTPSEAAAREAGHIRDLFTPALRGRTLALWAAVFCGLMVLYFIVSWITKLSIAAGLSETNGIYAGTLYNLGAFIGTSAMSFLAVRVPLSRLVPTMLVLAAGAMLAFGMLSLSIGLTLTLAFLIGVLLQGGYNGVWPLAANAYGDGLRATGVGWAIGVGRAGAVIGPMLGGSLMAAHVPLGGLFAAYCVPLLACALCASLVGKLSR